MALLPSINKRFGRGALGDMLLGGGLGLLSQGPSLTPQSPMGGLGQGLMMGRAMTEARRQREMDEARMALEREKFEASQAPSLQQFTGHGVYQVGPGGALGEQVLAPIPKVPDQPTSVEEYQYAQKQGYGGSYQDFLTDVKRQPPVSISLDAAKPVGTDAIKYVMPDGSTPPINATPSDIAAAGGRALTPQEAEERKVQATLDARVEWLERYRQRAQADYDAAAAAFEKNPDPTSEEARELSRAQNALRRAEAGVTNPLGEPSGDVARSVTPEPGVGRSMLEQGIDYLGGLLGGDSEAAPPGPVQQGQIETDDEGNRYEFMGGDPGDPASWRKLP